MDVPQSNVRQGFKFLMNRWNMFKESQRLFNRHIQNLSNVLPFVVNIERLLIVALPVAFFTFNVDVWQELHFDPNDPIPFAGFASSTLNVEGEATRTIAAHLRFGHLRKEVANLGEDAGIGSWV